MKAMTLARWCCQRAWLNASNGVRGRCVACGAPFQSADVVRSVEAAPEAPAHKPRPALPSSANDDRKSAIVTVQNPRARISSAPDMTPGEHRRQGEARREMKRKIACGTGGAQPPKKP